jgi:hypothetical protein
MVSRGRQSEPQFTVEPVGQRSHGRRHASATQRSSATKLRNGVHCGAGFGRR